MTRLVRALSVIVCAAGLLDACAAPEPETKEDARDGVRAWVDAYEEAWNTHDASALATFFSDDADMIIGNGPKVVGRAAVEDSWRSYFAGIDDARAGTFAIVSTRVIAPDVVVLDINSTTAGAGDSGEDLPTRLARGTWVVARHDGEWQILTFRALPAEGDDRSSPGRDP
jgi:uncharacterized protein (TIGR02246 family)